MLNNDMVTSIDEIKKQIRHLATMEEYFFISCNIDKPYVLTAFNEDYKEGRLDFAWAFAFIRAIAPCDTKTMNALCESFFLKIRESVNNLTKESLEDVVLPLPQEKYLYIGVNYEEGSCHVLSSGDLVISDILSVIEYALLCQLVQLPVNQRLEMVNSIDKMTRLIIQKKNFAIRHTFY